MNTFSPEASLENLEIEVSLKRETINNPIISQANIAIEYCRKHVYKPDIINIQEIYTVLYLKQNNQLIGHKILSIGDISSVVVSIKLALGIALKTLSSAIICLHNHPSGNLNPSSSDLKIAKKLKDACTLMDISLLDNIILTENNNVSGIGF